MLHRTSIALFAISLAACGGTVSSGASSGTSSQGGSSSGDPGTVPPSTGVSGSSSGSSSGGITSTQLATLDEVCDGDLALRGRAILAKLAAEYTPTFFPLNSAVGTPAKLSIQYEGGTITCRKADAGNTGGAPSRPAALELVVRISLTTDDGELNETMDGTLTGQAGGYLGYNGALPAAAKVGSIALVSMPGFDVAISVGGNIDAVKNTANGSVMQQGKKAPANGVGMGQVQGLGTLK